MKFLNSFLAVSFLSAGIQAHPHPEDSNPAVIARRHQLSKRCRPSVMEFHKKRYEQRSEQNQVQKRQAGGNSTYQITTEAPWFDVIQNDTCVLTPEVTQGPYWWPRSVLLRQEMAEDQVGVPLVLDIGVMDMATCEPLPDALVSLWHCNATGSYSSFTGYDPSVSLDDLLINLNITDFKMGVTDLHTDNSTFLRGMWPTGENGIMEMKSIFPGYYAARTVHIHVQVSTDWVVASNGTISTGNTISTGQIYFDESVSNEILAIEPYASNDIYRVMNDVDEFLPQSTVGGFSPFINVVPMDGENIENGVVGYITLGVDTEVAAI